MWESPSIHLRSLTHSLSPISHSSPHTLLTSPEWGISRYFTRGGTVTFTAGPTGAVLLVCEGAENLGPLAEEEEEAEEEEAGAEEEEEEEEEDEDEEEEEEEGEDDAGAGGEGVRAPVGVEQGKGRRSTRDGGAEEEDEDLAGRSSEPDGDGGTAGGGLLRQRRPLLGRPPSGRRTGPAQLVQAPSMFVGAQPAVPDGLGAAAGAVAGGLPMMHRSASTRWNNV